MNHPDLHRANLLVMHTDPILRAGVVAALRQHPDFDVFVHGEHELPSGGQDVDAVIADYATAVRLTDRSVRGSYKLADGARTLALTPNDREADIRRAVEAGVHGYVLAGGPLNELIDAVKAVSRGFRYVSPSAAQRIADSLTRRALTARETDVLQLAASGQPNKSIARHLGIGLGTVKSHMSAVMAKLGAGCRTEAARIAASRGLVGEASDANPEPRWFPSPARAGSALIATQAQM